MNLAASFYETCRRVPDNSSIQNERGRSFSYAEIRDRVYLVRGLLAQRDLSPGDRVLLSFPNGVEFVCAYLAVLSAGCVAVLVDPNSTSSHVNYVIENAGVSFSLCSAGHSTISNGERTAVLADLCDVDLQGSGDDFLDRQPVGRSGDDHALIIYTSGTTGTPKGVCLSHGNLIYSRDAICEWAAIGESDRELSTLSMNHLFGLAHLHIYLDVGAFVRIHERFRNAPATLEAISREHITSFPGTPASFRILLDKFPKQLAEHCGSLRYIIINSAPLEPTYVRRLMDALPHVRIYMYYGLTEASRATYICYNDHPEKLSTVGRPHPPAEIRLGPENEIQVRGSHVSRGYWGMDSSEHIVDGWLRTGDVGAIDDDGFLTWRGRLKEQINVDGLKVTPGEVEAVVVQHPHVKEAAAFAMADALTGDAVACAVVAEAEAGEGLELEIRKYCRGRLANYQIPRRILVVDKIPKTDAGKVQRLKLRNRVG
jgi:long-chain acyl-CoA synthetase